MIDAFIRDLERSNRNYMLDAFAMWRRGLQYEVHFWNNWLQEKGGPWPEDYQSRLHPRPLADWLVHLLPPEMSRPIRVLDVGAGPITKTGTFIPDRNSEIIAVDPLANAYNTLLHKYNIVPPIRTQFGFTEDISARFEPNSLDLISCTNALDHAIEPLWGLIEMFICLQSGANIFLSHRCNEATVENYSGFHQWNFDSDGDDFIIWNKSVRHNVTRMFDGLANISTQKTYSDQFPYISVTVNKIKDIPIDQLSYQRAMRAGVLEILTHLFDDSSSRSLPESIDESLSS